MNITYHIALLLLFQLHFFAVNSPTGDACQKLNENNPAAANIVFKSADGGQTWQDISEGLPENLNEDAIQRDGFFANDSGFYLRVGNGIYRSKPASKAPFWEKKVLSTEQGSIAPGKTGIFAYNYSNGQFAYSRNGSNVWTDVYKNFGVKEIRTVFETTAGTLFIGCDNGLFKSSDNGKTWKQVQNRGWILKLAESNGVLMATSQRGIVRSMDNGDSWEPVLSQGGVGIALERIKGGFAAISFSTLYNVRTVQISYDNGETWQRIDAGLPPDLSTSSIIEVGEYFFCGHPGGIFRSADKGKTWKLILPSIGDKVFNLSACGNVIYAIRRSGGC